MDTRTTTTATEVAVEEVRRTPASSIRRSARNSRVHFDGLLPIDPDEETHPISVQDLAEEHHKTVGVYLGFLQEDHKYEVVFKIPAERLNGFLNSTLEHVRLQSPATSCSVRSMHSVDGKHLELVVDLEVRQGTFFEDKFTIQSEDESNSVGKFVHVKISAQILGKGMGTPMLKHGITCTGVPQDEDAASDVCIADDHDDTR